MARLTQMQNELNVLITTFDNACIKYGTSTYYPEELIIPMYKIYKTCISEQDKKYFKDVLRYHLDFLYLTCISIEVDYYGYLTQMGVLDVILTAYIYTNYIPDLGKRYFDFSITFSISGCFKGDGINSVNRIFVALLYNMCKTIENYGSCDVITNKLISNTYELLNISILTENSMVSGLVRKFFVAASAWGITNEHMFGYRDITQTVYDIMNYNIDDEFGKINGQYTFFSLLKHQEAVTFEGMHLYDKFMDTLTLASNQIISWCEYIADLRHYFIYLIVTSKYRAYRLEENLEGRIGDMYGRYNI